MSDILILYFAMIIPSFVIGYIVDLIIGDPHGMWHPIIFIGQMISAFEKGIRKMFPKTKNGELAGGLMLVILILICSAGIPAVLLLLAYWLHWIVGFVLQCYMCYAILATRSLKTESMKVKTALETEGLDAGRKAVSMIVGRDTQNLTEEGVVKAAVETIAENTSDGIIAPMIFIAIGGPVLGFFYKGANTMDSMVGYKNDRYLYFGRCAAKFDDIVNYLPARISALLMILSSYIIRLSGKNAARIWKRDRRKHASPNSAQTEAVMAGALEVQLAGDAWYFGKKHEKPFIGDPIRPIEREDIRRANRLLYATATVSLILFCLIRLAVYLPVILEQIGL